MQKRKGGAWLTTHSTFSMDIFCCSWLIQAVLCPFAQPERTWHGKSQFMDIWSSFLISSVLHLFLESDHLMVIREKILSTKAFEPGTLRTNETSWTCWSTLLSLSFGKLPLLTGGFCGILSGFLDILPASTKLFIELVYSDCLCHFEGSHHLLQVIEGKLLIEADRFTFSGEKSNHLSMCAMTES